VRTELLNVQHITGQNVDLATLWSSFMVRRLEDVKSNGETWLKDNIKVAEDAYDTEIKKLRAIEKELVDEDRRSTQAQKDTKANQIKTLQDKLNREYKQLKKRVDDAEQEVEDQKDRVEAATGRKREAEVRQLERREKDAYDALVQMNLKGREFNVLTLQGVRFELKSSQDELDILAKFKTASRALKMPKSV